MLRKAEQKPDANEFIFDLDMAVKKIIDDFRSIKKEYKNILNNLFSLQPCY